MFGGIVAFDTNTTIVHEPALAVELLDNRSRTFDIRGNFLNQHISPDAAAHATEVRRHLNPGMRKSVVGALRERTRQVMYSVLAGSFASESQLRRPVDPLPVLQDALSQVVSEFYFGDDWEQVRDGVGKLLDALNGVFGNCFALPAAVPSLARLRIKRRYVALRLVVDELVRERSDGQHRRRGAHDYGAEVTHAARSLDGLSISRISDLIIGSLLAAHQVPAAAVAWVLYEIGCDARLQEGLVAELRAAPGQGLVSRGGSELLPHVVRESLRLHPPTWLLRRTASTSVSLGGFDFPAGHHFLVSPYVLHRDESQFANASMFLPSRWKEGGRPRAFMPYGRGQRACPGSSLATVVVESAIEALLGSWRIGPISADSVVADARSTLVPAGLRLQLLSYDVRTGHPLVNN